MSRHQPGLGKKEKKFHTEETPLRQRGLKLDAGFGNSEVTDDLGESDFSTVMVTEKRYRGK